MATSVGRRPRRYVAPGRRPEALLRHGEGDEQPQHDVDRATRDQGKGQVWYGKANVSAGEGYARRDADDAPYLSGLRPPEKYPPYPTAADLVRNPGLPRPGIERRADSPEDLGEEDHSEHREQALDDEPGADEECADDHGKPPAVDVCDNTGGDLKQESRDLQHGADEDELQRIETGLHDAVHGGHDRVHGERGGSEALDNQVDGRRLESPNPNDSHWVMLQEQPGEGDPTGRPLKEDRVGGYQ